MTAPSHTPASPQAPATIRGLRSRLDERISDLPVWVVVAQVFLGLGWLRAAAEKLISGAWWRGEVIEAFLAEHEAQTLGWYQPFLDLVVVPHVVLIAVLVAVAQIAVGVILVRGRFVGFALAVGATMNLSFMAAGAVNPSAFYLLIQGAIALWLAEQTQAKQRTARVLVSTAAGSTVLAALSVPFVSTLHPHGVIEDPAVVMLMGGVLTVVGCDLAHRRVTDSDGLL